MPRLQKLDDVIYVSEYGKLTFDLWKNGPTNILVLDLAQVDKGYSSIIKTLWTDGNNTQQEALTALLHQLDKVMSCTHDMVPGAGGEGRSKCKHCILETR